MTWLGRWLMFSATWMALVGPAVAQGPVAKGPVAFVTKYCVECHGPKAKEAGLDLSEAPRDLDQADRFRAWVKAHDRLAAGEMPPKESPQPSEKERAAAVQSLREMLLAADRAAAANNDRGQLRRLTRFEYEHTLRDLFDLPGLALAEILPADGSAGGFDRLADALDLSHVNVAKYLAAADHLLDHAIATRPRPPQIQRRRISLVNDGGFVDAVVMNGDGVLLKNRLPDPDFPPAAEQNHLNTGAHQGYGSFSNGASVGLFRHEDDAFFPYFRDHVTIYPGTYRARISLSSFRWDKGTVLPGRGTEVARLSIVQLTGNGSGILHPSQILGYFDAPVDGPREHEVRVWLNRNEIFGFNTASLAPASNHSRKGRAMAFTGPGIIVDWFDIEGPFHETWPPRGHQLIFGDLPIEEFKPADHPGVRPPARPKPRQIGGKNLPDPESGVWTVRSDAPKSDAERLLRALLPKLFRREVSAKTLAEYVGVVERRLSDGDCFETAMRAACKTALCSADFLHHVEPAATNRNQDALACRLSYLLWSSLPDDSLRSVAANGGLRKPEVLHAEVDRLLADSRSRRFVDDFVGQWLKLRLIAANDPDHKLYPEFNSYLQDAMVAETRAYFREMIDRDLNASHVVRSDFVMLNERLAAHYGVDGVTGCRVRRVPLPAGCPRGGLLTQAAVLKVTANGTVTSPVPRGAFVMDRILGEPPELPPSNVAAIEPDVRGATTIREQLAKHRDNAACASCHARIDPPGFALESFDVIGGWRDRYRSIGVGDPPPRGNIDPFIGIGFKLGPKVDPSATLPGGDTFANIGDYQVLLAKQTDRLLRNLARQLTTYAIGRELRFSDRDAIDEIVRRTKSDGGGLRSLIHRVVGSPLFAGSATAIDRPRSSPPFQFAASDPDAESGRLLMMATLPTKPHVVPPPLEQPTPPSREYHVRDDRTVTARVTGLFAPERLPYLREKFAEILEAKLLRVDFDTAEATIAYDPDSELGKNVNEAQLIGRLNNRLSSVTRSTLGLRPLGPVPRDKLERVEIPIVGLDCAACSHLVCSSLQTTDGVEHATASFRERKAVAWIDPSKTNRGKLIERLKEDHVTFGE